VTWDILLGIFLLWWVVGALFVAAVGGATGGLRGFIVWLLAALIFSPPLALLGMIAVLIRNLERRLETQAELLSNAAQEEPTGFQRRFASLADDE
jgi:hypothetical protein